jgi:hypothetical protein
VVGEGRGLVPGACGYDEGRDPDTLGPLLRGCGAGPRMTGLRGEVVHLLTGQPTEVIHRCGDRRGKISRPAQIRQPGRSDWDDRHELHGCKLLTMCITSVDNFRPHPQMPCRFRSEVLRGAGPGCRAGRSPTGGARCPGRLRGPEPAMRGLETVIPCRSTPGRIRTEGKVRGSVPSGAGRQRPPAELKGRMQRQGAEAGIHGRVHQQEVAAGGTQDGAAQRRRDTEKAPGKGALG